ncbi:MAG: hypothetical protein OJI74_11545 [Rhodanobacter thiooxydans]|nr:hypothetical protein [Rhodanobacter thiooxydans]
MHRLSASLKKRGLSGLLVHALMDLAKPLQSFLIRMRDHTGSARTVGEPIVSESLIVILAGYKPRLWPLTLRRIAKYAPRSAAVCVVTAGKFDRDLEKFCGERGWCYMSVSKNKTGLALNKAVALHPAAKWIYKIDEDVFIADGFFDDLRAGYEYIQSEGLHNPGFCAPLLNVNGISYLTFLERIGATEDYHERFGEIRVSCSGVHAHYDPEAASWLWRRSLPFDPLARRFRQFEPSLVPDPIMIGSRFSIGAILLQRDFLDAIGGFRSTWREGILGVDESALCVACVEQSRPMFYLRNVFAGHFSFFPQERGMMEAWPELEQLDPIAFSMAP